ncbi:mitochondrial tRNA-specific 2-thiouridylase 1 [Cylas formicarius]|uniref:mitochondrial tRNA-specific 2-thiouridylase 1 n=1 Tax=Cylas formicarius TaxID=197179 RepID=UPI002958A5F2|nr:mitochondrial tRNA-specific 2-thiouridylase 1 [Cylas formicarius]
MFKKIALGISGGVDSAVAALLLKTKGYDVEGVFMKNWDIADETGKCTADEDFKDASDLCERLNIKLHRVNFVKQYWNEVFCDLIKEYEHGYTPNPDVLCNRRIKFNHFSKFAFEELEADAIATGHYAKTSFGNFLENYNANQAVRLLRPKDLRKDQTFFLCQVRQEPLRRTMFPLGDLRKSEVKRIAAENHLERYSQKPESMGICFIGSRNFQHFIGEYIESKPGKFIDIDSGKVVGTHDGLHQWTVGQRTRLQGVPDAYFVARKNVDENIIYVALGTTHPALFSDLLRVSKPHWIHSRPEELERAEILRCDFKFQHTEGLVPCRICEITDENLCVHLDQAQRALTPGQYAVFYRNDECLGSGKILNPGATNFSLHYMRNSESSEASNDLEASR